MKRLALGVALCVAALAGAIACASSNQSGPIRLGDGKLGGIPIQLGDGQVGNLDMCRAANIVLAGATIYGEATGDPRVTTAMAFAPSAFALLGCDPAASNVVFSPEQCQALANVIAAYRLSGKSNPRADDWIARLWPKLCSGTVIPDLPPVPKHGGDEFPTVTPTPGHGEGPHEHTATPTPVPTDHHGGEGHATPTGTPHHTPTKKPGHGKKPTKVPGGDDHEVDHS